jgi:hypothetical protein
LAVSPLSQAETVEAAKEYQIKAAYTAKLASFITWPDEHFSSEDAPIKLCILGEDLFNTSIDIAAKKVKGKGRSVEVHRQVSDTESATCHILFVSQSEQRRVPFIIGRLIGQPVLTVSDTDAFLKQGGMVEFYTNAQRQIRLQVDPETIQDGGLKVSTTLLNIGRKRD